MIIRSPFDSVSTFYTKSDDVRYLVVEGFEIHVSLTGYLNVE